MSPVDSQQKKQKRIREATRSLTMKNLVALLCMVYALVVSVESFTCKSCLNRTGNTCDSEDVVDCKKATGCSTISGFIRFNATKTPFLYKGCQYPIKSGEWLCITSDDFDCQSYIRSCEGENCNPDYYIPVDNEAENGYVCPYCYEENNTGGCSCEKEVKCRGNDTLCVEYRGILRNPDGSEPGTSFKSCANDVGYANLPAFFGFTVVNTTLFTTIKPIKTG